MNIKRIILIITAILTVSLCVVLYGFRNINIDKIDVVAVNDICKSLADVWGSLDESELPGMQYGMDYVVLDNTGDLIKATRRGLNENINSAISNRDTIVDIKSGNKVLGKLIIYNDTDKTLKQYKQYLLVFSVVLLFLIAILCLAYAFFIDTTIFRPFRKLQCFASHVAAGNLDVPLEMDKGNLFGAFTESFDLMREELNKARENERIANQSKKELVASLSHDIKTPVASIKAVSEVMFAKSYDMNQRKQLEVINSKADQINTLITNMFSATLEELQELRVAPSEESSQILYDLIRKADYNDKVRVTDISECIILADKLRLEQVIDNLISNSYKYAGTTITVSTQMKEKYLEISFKDYGQGVSMDEKPLLFNKYYRAKNAEGKSGAGLGLYISKYLMNQMSGDISCENTEDGFIVILKLLIV